MTTPLHEEQLPEHDVIGILLRQHNRIKELFADVGTADGEHRQQAFDELRALLAAHETAEEMVLRPVSRSSAGADVADARNSEEDQATHMLADLEKLDVDSAEFRTSFAEFERAVLTHAQNEEQLEFPSVETDQSREQLERMGRALLAAERTAPTHPHPGAAGSTAAQWTIGPFASLVDRARDAVSSVTSRD
ncbi:MAG TPA: hemerythrin domain-containing protein [Kineosporiaceae bacterium]